MKKYCSSCAHLNPEGANFCENCGVKLPVSENAPLQSQAGVNKWKVFSVVSIVVIVILATGLFSLYTSYNQLQNDYQILNNSNNLLITSYNILNSSYNILLDSNKRLEDKITHIIDEGLIQNQTYHSYMLRYTDEMVQYVKASGPWYTAYDTAERTFGENIGRDLNDIHSQWAYGDFNSHINNNSVYNSMETIQRIGGDPIGNTLPNGQTYLDDINLYLWKENVSTAPSIFKVKGWGGVCYHYARVLAALYDCYFDLFAKKPYSVYCLDCWSSDVSNFGHECVLIKDNNGKVAIIDWEVITHDEHDISVIFVSINEAVKLHEQYWAGRSNLKSMNLHYYRVYSRDSDISFNSNDEFYAWAQGHG